MSAYFNPTIAGLTVRATLGRRRAFLFAIPAVILIALTLVLRASKNGPGVLWPDRVLGPDSGKLAFALFIGALAGSVIYSAVFLLASVLTTRAIAFGLLYVLIWEGLLSNLVGGARILSIAHYCLGIANAIHPDVNLNAGLTLATSVILGVIVTVGSLILATRRLSAFAIQG